MNRSYDEVDVLHEAVRGQSQKTDADRRVSSDISPKDQRQDQGSCGVERLTR